MPLNIFVKIIQFIAQVRMHTLSCTNLHKVLDIVDAHTDSVNPEFFVDRVAETGQKL